MSEHDIDRRHLVRRGQRTTRWVWWDLVFLLCCLAYGTVRFLILRRGGAPPTVDAGNWLALADSMLGSDVRSSTIVYPPSVPLLTKASVVSLGLTNGVSLLAALTSLAPASGVYVALRCVGLAGHSLVPALLVLGASSVGEATAWGGFPQLIGLGLMPVALILLDRLLQTWAVRHAVLAGAALMGIMATSHFIAGVAVLAAAGLLVGRVRAVRRTPPGWRRGVTRLGLVLLPSLWLVPLYWTLGRLYAGGFPALVAENRLTWANWLGRIEFQYRDTPWLWRILLPLALIAPFVLWRKHRTALWRTTVSLVAAIAFATVLTREDRFLYALAPLTALGLALWISWGLEAVGATRSRGPGTARLVGTVAAALLAVLLGAVGLQFVRSTEFFSIQRDYYGILTPGLVEGIEYARESSTPGTVVAVPSVNDAPLGWWVEAVAQRPTVYGCPLGWLVFDDETRRARFANELFAPVFPTAEKLQSAREAGIGLVLLPTMWAFFDDTALGAVADEGTESIVQLNEHVVVIRLDAHGS